MPEEGDFPSAFEVLEEMNQLFDASDFRTVRTTLEDRVSNQEARDALGAFQDFQDRAVDRDLLIDYTELEAAGMITPGGSTTYHGWDGWLEHWRVWFEAWDAIEVDQREVEVIDQERVLTWSVGRVTGRGSGAELPWSSAFSIWTVREGKIVRIDGYPTRERALDAAGH